MTAVTGLSSEAARFSWLDLSVATSICLIAVLLVFPAIQDSRYNARRTGCQNNLRMIGLALAHITDQPSSQAAFPYCLVQRELAGWSSWIDKTVWREWNWSIKGVCEPTDDSRTNSASIARERA